MNLYDSEGRSDRDADEDKFVDLRGQNFPFWERIWLDALLFSLLAWSRRDPFLRCSEGAHLSDPFLFMVMARIDGTKETQDR